ncbi:MAG: OprO/OprP family phosphate-selective porin, partial [Armatimonadetes bacterium]|nr:OprO/OprP family phosphate-selective porin [Armatimonadota bacterium]
MNSKPILMFGRTLSAVAALAIATVASGEASAQAQQSEIELLRQQIAEMQARLLQIEEAQKKVAAPVVPTVASGSKSPLTVSGLLHVNSLNFFSDDVQNGGTRGTDTFRLRRGQIRLTAPAITPRVSATIMFDPTRTAATRNSTGGTSATRLRQNVLQDMILSYQLSQNANSSHFVDVGQFKIPIGYESLVSSGALQNVERALVFTQRDPFTDSGYGDVRDTGIQLRGRAGQFDYRVGVFNGFGDRQNGLALSDAKAILARLAFKPQNIEGLEIGVSGGKGKTGTDQTLGTGANLVSNPRVDRDLFNAFATYKKDRLTLIGEYLKGDSQDIFTTATSGTPAVSLTTAQTRDISGYYAHIGYLLRPKLEATLRYDQFKSGDISSPSNTAAQNSRLGDSTVRDITLGLNYYLKGNNAKIQTNLVRRSSGGGVTLNPALRNDQLQL